MSVEAEIIWLRLLLQIASEQVAIERAAALPHPAEAMGFDAWMQHRTDAAHADYMKRTSKRLACDWRVFPPEQISRYFGIPLEELA